MLLLSAYCRIAEERRGTRDDKIYKAVTFIMKDRLLLEKWYI